MADIQAVQLTVGRAAQLLGGASTFQEQVGEPTSIARPSTTVNIGSASEASDETWLIASA